jgi:hypothetical protein
MPPRCPLHRAVSGQPKNIQTTKSLEILKIKNQKLKKPILSEK